MPKRPARKGIPVFASEREEREFWETHDVGPFVDWAHARVGVFPNLKPSTETISLRLPTALLSELKALANKRDVPYQSLLKVFLADRVAGEMVRINALPNKAVQPTSRAGRRARARRSARAARG
jgi:predicted DNA binding CopG/RHH family protein